MDVQADLAELRDSIMTALSQCERMLEVASHHANEDSRQHFLDRAAYWSDIAIRRAVEIRTLLSSSFALPASDEAQLELSFSGVSDIREAASV